MYAPLGPRKRMDVTPAGRESRLPQGVGYFESAQVNGLGQVIKWDPLTRTSPNPTSPDSPWKARFSLDEVHPGFPLAGGPFLSIQYANDADPGGVFSNTIVYNQVINPGVNGGKPYSNRRFIGGFIHPANSVFGLGFDFSVPGPLLTETNPQVSSMNGLHDRAWKATKPYLEQSSALVDAAELDEAKGMVNGSKDFLLRSKATAERFNDLYLERQMRGSRWGRSPIIGPKAVADEFLNQSFGWVPFLSSILDWTKILGHYENLVKKLTKKNGVPVRKRVVLDDETSSVVLSKGSAAPGTSYPMHCYPTAWDSNFFVGPPTWELREDISRTSWGVGKFTYYRPEFDITSGDYYDTWSKAKRFLTITGLRISPSALYNMIPWTWLVDYVTDLGNWIDFLTDIWQDQIVAHYCFAMQTTVKARTFTNVLPFNGGTRALSFRRTITVKQRDMADNPFGFGLTLEDLTPRQLAIVGALGLSGSIRRR